MSSATQPAGYPSHTDALRDRFAEAALVGILSNPNARVVDPRDAAKLAYQYAESMLLERRR